MMQTFTRVFEDGGKITLILDNGKVVGLAGALTNRDFKRWLEEISFLKQGEL